MSPTQGRTPLADVDSAWLRMDDPTNLMVVTGRHGVRRSPSRSRRSATSSSTRLLKFPRFRQRVVDDAVVGAAQWEPDRWFSLDYHLVQATFPENGTEAALQRFISELMSQPLDPRRPLWQFHFIPHYQGGSALDHAHPPLHRRRPRVDLRDAVDGRRRARRAATSTTRTRREPEDVWNTRRARHR